MVDFKGLNATATQPIFTHFRAYGREEIAVVLGIGDFVIVTGRDVTGAAVGSSSGRGRAALALGS